MLNTRCSRWQIVSMWHLHSGVSTSNQAPLIANHYSSFPPFSCVYNQPGSIDRQSLFFLPFTQLCLQPTRLHWSPIIILPPLHSGVSTTNQAPLIANHYSSFPSLSCVYNQPGSIDCQSLFFLPSTQVCLRPTRLHWLPIIILPSLHSGVSTSNQAPLIANHYSSTILNY